MAPLRRGQPPARQTKVVHHKPRCIKVGSGCGSSDCCNEVLSSKPASAGRDSTDALQSRVGKCESPRCKTCDYINVCSSFKSNVTNRQYSIVSPHACLDCGTKNVIYLIFCKKCGVQYVGKTSQTLRSRFNNHRTRLKQLCDLFLYEHFNSDGHTHNDISIMPIEEVILMPGERLSLAQKLSAREEFWYKELGSVYPYGLNDNVSKVGNISRKLGKELIIYRLFNKQPRKYHVRKSKRNRHHRTFRDVQEELKSLLVDYKSGTFGHRLRTLILSIPRRCLFEIMSIVEHFQLQELITSRVAWLVRDLIGHRRKVHMAHDNLTDDKRKQDNGFINIYFHNKGIEMINIPRILRSKRVVRAVPGFLGPYVPPMVCYSYTKSISPTILNYKHVVRELDFNVGTEHMTCNCVRSKYCYAPAGHVVTGNLRILTDFRVRELVMKGPSYREQNNINWDLNLKLCKEAVKKFRMKWADVANVSRCVFREWEKVVEECIMNKITALKKKYVHKRKKQILKNPKHVNYLKTFHDSFVLVPADKAGNNVIVICKKYYLQVILEELANSPDVPSTYVEVGGASGDIIRKHVVDIGGGMHIPIAPVMEKLPSFYWLPKLHKTPYGSRFIAASSQCTTKPLSNLLTSCLTTIMVHFKEYCDGIYRNTGVNCFWIIKNSQQVLQCLQMINETSKARHFDSFDFSTLYTSIPHGCLKHNMNVLIREAYQIRGSQYLSINKYGVAYWSQSRSGIRNMDMNELINMLEYLVDNIFIQVGNKTFRQCIGIPMGTDCAPLLANLFLFYYEYSFMRGLIKTNINLAKSFSTTVRYIDDLLTLNNTKFQEEITNIYPSELILKKTTESIHQLSYLDICIQIKNYQYFTSVYDKRDSFGFNIVNFPFLSSNIPVQPAYGVYISQLVRIGRICVEYEDFCKRNYALTSKLIRQGFWYHKLCLTFKKFAKRHCDVFSKFKMSVKRHIGDGICLPVSVLPTLTMHVSSRRPRTMS